MSLFAIHFIIISAEVSRVQQARKTASRRKTKLVVQNNPRPLGPDVRIGEGCIQLISSLLALALLLAHPVNVRMYNTHVPRERIVT